MPQHPPQSLSLSLRPRTPLPHLEPEYRIEAFPATIGRHPTNDIELPYDSISRFHARIELRSSQAWIIDLRSSNGTFLNGLQVADRPLKEGDVLSFGGIEMIVARAAPVRSPEADDSTEAPDSRTSVHFLQENGDDIVQTVVEADVPGDGSDISSVHRPVRDERELQRANERLVTFYRLQEILRGTSEEKNLLRRVLSLLFESLPVERGAILTRDPQDPTLFNPVATRVREGITDRSGIGISRTILKRCLEDKVAILTRDAGSDDRFGSAESIHYQRMRSVLCVPLISRHQVLGFIQLDTSVPDGFDEADLSFLTNFAVAVAIELHNIRMVREKIMAERMAAIGQTITGLAHNIKNVLLLSKGGMELMQERISERDDEELTETWRLIQRGIDRINLMVKDMLDYGRQRQVRKQRVNVNDLMAEIHQTFSEEMSKRRIRCVLDVDPHCPAVLADPDGLDKAIVNLLINAAEECVEGEGEIRLRTRCEGDNAVVLEVTDNAGGIPPDVLPRIFFPFFTTKGTGGSGLGLAMTKKFVEDMGGRIEVESKQGFGTTFRITLFADRRDVRLDASDPEITPPPPVSTSGV